MFINVRVISSVKKWKSKNGWSGCSGDWNDKQFTTLQELSEETKKDSAVINSKNRFGIDQNEFTLQQHSHHMTSVLFLMTQFCGDQIQWPQNHFHSW